MTDAGTAVVTRPTRSGTASRLMIDAALAIDASGRFLLCDRVRWRRSRRVMLPHWSGPSVNRLST